MIRSKLYFSFHSDLTVCLGMVSFPLFSLEKYSGEIGGVHHMHGKSECWRHIRHRKETRGLSVGSDRVDTRKIPGMLRKHSFPGSQTEEEGNKSMETYIPTHSQVTDPQLSKSIQRLLESSLTVQQIQLLMICHSKTKLKWALNKSDLNNTNCHLIYTKNTWMHWSLKGVIACNLFALQHFTEPFVLSLHMFFIV